MNVRVVVALFAMLTVAFWAVPTGAFAATIYTNSSTGNDSTGDGSSGAPYKTFHKAYTSASAGDTINVAGTFDWSDANETGDSTTTGYTLSKSLTIEGTSASAATIQASSTEYTANRKIFTVTGTGVSVTLQNLTLKNGYINTDSGAACIDMASSASLTMINTVLTMCANAGRFGDGGISVSGSGTFVLRNSTLHDNNGVTAQASTGSSWPGYTGGIRIANTGATEITNSTFFNNGASYNGAIMVNHSSARVTITNSTFLNNKGSVSSSDILAWSGIVYLANTIFADKAGSSSSLAKGSGSFTDGGNNIIETQSSAGFSNGVNGNLVGDQASLNISASLAVNSATSSVPTLALSTGSVAINAGTTTANNGITIPALDQRNFTRSGIVDIGAYEFGGGALDATPPSISSISVATTSSTATITWTTNEAASTKVNFGLTSLFGTSTPETDTSTRVTSHSTSLSGLTSCTRYYFEVYSADASSNSATSTADTFLTSGCTGSSSITATSDGSITTAAGGSLSRGNLSLTVPTSYTATSSSAVFQAHEIDADTFFAAVSAPTGKSRAGAAGVFTLMALTDATTTLATFDTALSVTLSYSDSDVSGLDESSLRIYRYDGADWYALSSCSVDTTANTVTCTTTAFSDFSIFGDTVTSSSSSSSSTVGGGASPWCSGPTAPGWNASLPGGGCSDVVAFAVAPIPPVEAPTAPEAAIDPQTAMEPPAVSAPAETAAPTASSIFIFTRTLRAGSEGNDVRELQKFLNMQGFMLAPVGVGSPGNETTYFGPMTWNALVKFQEAHAADILAPIGIAKGTGIFGPSTRAFMQSLAQ